MLTPSANQRCKRAARLSPFVLAGHYPPGCSGPESSEAHRQIVHIEGTLEPNQGPPEVHGRRIWSSRVPNKVKVFSWLYFKDRLSTRANLCAKSILDTDQCQRCSAGTQDWHHVFFVCPTSAGVWARLNMSHVAALSDVDIWNADTPPNLDAKMWPFVLQSILWRLWDARNGTIFRNEHPSSRSVSSKISDDLVIWRKRFKNDSDVHSLNSWRAYLLYCNSSNSSTVVDP